MGSTAASGTNSAMSMTWEASPSRALNSSSVKRTYSSLANSYPLTKALRSTVSLQCGQKTCCRIRLPHLAWRRLNETPPDAAAVYRRTGMETSPKEMVPEPIEWGGIVCTVPRSSLRFKAERYLAGPTADGGRRDARGPTPGGVSVRGLRGGTAAGPPAIVYAD